MSEPNQDNSNVDTGSIADEFVYEREFSASPKTVWSAWTDPEALKVWFGPAGMEMAHLEQDLREGGFMHYGLRSRAATPKEEDKSKWIWGLWIYRTLQAPNLLEAENRFSDPDRGTTRHPMSDKWPLNLFSRTTFEPVDDGKKTKLTLRWRPLKASAEECAEFKSCHSKCTGGWTAPMNALEEYLKTSQLSKEEVAAEAKAVEE